MIKVGSPQFLFMAEAEGMTDVVSTHTAKLNAVVKDLRNYPSRHIPGTLIGEVAAKHGISDVSDEDWTYIYRELTR